MQRNLSTIHTQIITYFVWMEYIIIIIWFYWANLCKKMSLLTLHLQCLCLLCTLLTLEVLSYWEDYCDHESQAGVKRSQSIPSLSWYQVHIIGWVESLSIWPMIILFLAWNYRNITLSRSSQRSRFKIGVKGSRRSL
jgi:hypothetical protein